MKRVVLTLSIHFHPCQDEAPSPLSSRAQPRDLQFPLLGERNSEVGAQGSYAETEGETADPSAALGMTKDRVVLHLGMVEGTDRA